MERVHLGDWLYNAGIIGFLKINSHLWDVKNKKLKSKDESLLKIGENYIEFDRKIFDGYAERYFEKVWEKGGSYYSLLKKIEELLEEVSELEDNEKLKKIFKEAKKLKTNNIKDKLKEDSKEAIINHLKRLKKDIEGNKDTYMREDVKTFLKKFYGGKSFLNSAFKGDEIEKFKESFENKLKTGDYEKDDLVCRICYERHAQNKEVLDTGISNVYGINKENINFAWDFKTEQFPKICDICEIIYFSAILGLTHTRQNDKDIFYFVNDDSSVLALLGKNEILQDQLEEEKGFQFINFLNRVILDERANRSIYGPNSLLILEIDINKKSKASIPRVVTLNIPRDKIKFILDQDRKKELKKLEYVFYSENKGKFSVLKQLIDLFVKNALSYDYLNLLFRKYINGKDTNIKIYHLKIINKFLKEYYEIFLKEYYEIVGGIKMSVSEKEINKIFFSGKEIAEKMKSKNEENKIQSIAYKLLNALRVGNTNQFMDNITRLYIGYDIEMPSIFVRYLSDKPSFYQIGYAFLTGLLSIDKDNENEKKENLEVNK